MEELVLAEDHHARMGKGSYTGHKRFSLQSNTAMWFDGSSLQYGFLGLIADNYIEVC